MGGLEVKHASIKFDILKKFHTKLASRFTGYNIYLATDPFLLQHITQTPSWCIGAQYSFMQIGVKIESVIFTHG